MKSPHNNSPLHIGLSIDPTTCLGLSLPQLWRLAPPAPFCPLCWPSTSTTFQVPLHLARGCRTASAPPTLRPSLPLLLTMDSKFTSPQQQRLRIAAIVTAYFIISISLVFLNKVLMDKKTAIDAPIFMTWFQCIVTVGICWGFGELGQRSPQGSFFRQFPRFSYDIKTAAKLVPLSLVFVGMITLNNLCLKYVEVSFYNVARSLTIVFNVIFTYFLLGETTSKQTLACLALVIVGFFVGSESEVNFSLIGTMFGVMSSVFVSLNSIYTKRTMHHVDGNQWTLAAYNNMNAVLMFIPIIFISDESRVLRLSSEKLASMAYWTLMTLGGVFGFLIGIVTIMQIKETSPLTHNISGTAKACVQTVLALFIWGNETNFANMMGVFLVLGGSMAYSWVRTVEMDTAAAAAAAAKRLAAEKQQLQGKEEGMKSSTGEGAASAGTAAGQLSSMEKGAVVASLTGSAGEDGDNGENAMETDPLSNSRFGRGSGGSSGSLSGRR